MLIEFVIKFEVMFIMCLQMLTRVFMGSGESNLIFLKRVARRLRHFLMGIFVQREVMSKLFVVLFVYLCP